MPVCNIGTLHGCMDMTPLISFCGVPCSCWCEIFLGKWTV